MQWGPTMHDTRFVTDGTGNASQPTLSDFREVIEAIYRNRYFTNHGPLAIEFERALASYLDVQHVVTIGNDSLALLVALAGLELDGEVIVPAFCGDLPARIASGLNLKVTFADVCPGTYQPAMRDIEAARTDRSCAILLVETCGHRSDQRLVRELADQGWKVVVVAFDSFGATVENQLLADHPNVVTVYSFGQARILSTLQGGAIATNSSELANRFRNIRSSYGSPDKVDVLATCNGRFSEFQAGLGLKGLSKLSETIKRNRLITECYESVLRESTFRQGLGSSLTTPSNHQSYPVWVSKDFQIECDDLFEEYSVVRCGQVPESLEVDACPVSRSLSSEIFLLPVTDCPTLNDAKALAKKLLVRLHHASEVEG